MDYNNLLFHIVSHKVNKSQAYVQEQLAQYLENHEEAILQVAGEFLDQKGTTLTDDKNFIKQDGNHGDELSVYLLAWMANLAIIVITKNGVCSTFEGLVEDAELVLVYLGQPHCPPKNQNQNRCQKKIM